MRRSSIHFYESSTIAIKSLGFLVDLTTEVYFVKNKKLNTKLVESDYLNGSNPDDPKASGELIKIFHLLILTERN